jgi:hypothetical protein
MLCGNHGAQLGGERVELGLQAHDLFTAESRRYGEKQINQPRMHANRREFSTRDFGFAFFALIRGQILISGISENQW